MTPARVWPSLVALLLAGAVMPSEASQRTLPTPAAMRTPALIASTDVSASRRRAHRTRHATRVHVYRRGDYSFFEPYAPPVPPFFPFGYRQGYF
jgi:hypothetical protein